jgi:hypothetical protein
MARLLKSKAFPTSVFINKFDSGLFESGSDRFDSSQGNLSPLFLEVDDRRKAQAGRAGELRLRDFQ